MSSYRRSCTVIALAGALAAGACGFSPLYGEADARVSREELAAVRVAPLKDRSGQLLHRELTKGLNPSGLRPSPRWNLEIDLKQTVRQLGIRKDETATRANLLLDARFVLRELATGRVALKGRAVSTNSFNILESRFATIASESDALERAAHTLGDNIGKRVAIFLRRQAASNAGPKP